MRNLEQRIAELFSAQAHAGLACAAVRGDRTVWQAGFGWADVESEIAMTPETIMNIASVSKTLTATLVMKLWEEHGFSLDMDVNDVLPFQVRNPRFPKIKITVRQLLAHRSSILDGPAYDESYACGVCAEPLFRWLESHLAPGGEIFERQESYHAWAPGTVAPPETPRPYSNVGYGVLALVVESFARMPFEDACRKYLFDALGMVDSTWALEAVPEGRHAALYSWIPDDQEARAAIEFLPEERERAGATAPNTLFRHCLYELPIKSDGLLRTSVGEFARFLSIYTNGGCCGPTRILQTETLELMLGNEHFGRALCWQGGPRDNGSILWHHGGADPGVGTVITYDPLARLGILLFSNCAWTGSHISDIYQEIRSEFAP